MTKQSTDLNDHNFSELLAHIRAFILEEDVSLQTTKWPISESSDYLKIDDLSIEPAPKDGWANGYIKCHFRSINVDREASYYRINFHYNYLHMQFIVESFSKEWERTPGDEEWKHHE